MKGKIKWLKEHKKEVLIGAGGIIGTTVLITIGVKIKNTAIIDEKAHEKLGEKIFNAFMGDLGVDNRYCVDLEPIPIKDLGNIGSNFLKEIPEATEETLVQVIAYIEKKDLAA